MGVTAFQMKRAKTLHRHVEKSAMEEGEERRKDDLSEGEIVDSNEDGDEVQPAPAKKQKLSPELTGGKDSALDASVAINFGSWKSSLTKRQLKRLQRKSRKDKMVKIKNSSLKHAELTEQQVTVLQSLKQFRMGVPHSGTALPKLKTAQFKEIVSHLVQSQPQDDSCTAGDDSNGRTLVVWLSMVSERYYNQSPKHFPQLKKLTPALHFKLEHPGSNRFVKLGLEAFMLKSTQGDGNEGTQASPITSSESTSSSSPPPRTSYLFSKQQLEENGFPVMESPVSLTGIDCSEFLQLYPWPSVDVQESLSTDKSDAELPIFAIDCEMVETKMGSELARISIVNEALDCVYDTYVRPDSPVTDYRTQYSGISEETLVSVTTTLQDVQEKLKLLLPPRCIFAGHSLENDFIAMKLVHPYVIDTSCIFTPHGSPFFKPKLKRLSMELLSSEIQGGSDGHNSIEDATACMKLVQRKLKEGDSLTVSFGQPTLSLLSELQLCNYTTGIVDKVGVVRLFGRHSTHRCETESDAETVERAIEVVPECDLTFVQLHDMEKFVKSASKNDVAKQLQVANEIDSNVLKLIENCPDGTLVFVICGSSDISKVKQFQQQDFPDMRRWKEATMVARTAQVTALMVN